VFCRIHNRVNRSVHIGRLSHGINRVIQTHKANQNTDRFHTVVNPLLFDSILKKPNNAGMITASDLQATDAITFTDAAATKVHSLIVEENNPALNLRVFITGGGCSGFQYGFTFDETINDDDCVVEKKITSQKKENDKDGNGGNGSVTVKLLIDVMSFQYLKGATIDYREDINGAQFVIKNPNAKTTCGCGSSFSA
jgi:iron-sulfur cluster insertion protein